MTPEVYRRAWAAWQQAPETERLRHLTRQIALSFVDRCLYNDRYEGDYIDLLCEMATAGLGEERDRITAGALFGIVIESLCDDFEEFQTTTYNRVMCQVVEYCCGLPAGARLARELTAFGCGAGDRLLARIERLRSAPPQPPQQPPERVVVLSRVTIGADVAVTSVIMERLRRAFPETELVLVGSEKLGELFGGHAGLRLRPLHYARRGGLLQRFETWLEVVAAVREECAGGARVLVVDPDSRLSQLGVLPVAAGADYWFFNSRTAVGAQPRQRISELANAWLDDILGASAPALPAVHLPAAMRDRGQAVIDRLRAAGARHVVCVNLGVGGNPRKGLSEDFEHRLLQELLAAPQTVVVLDRGFGDHEQARSARLLQRLQADGVATASGAIDDVDRALGDHGVLGVGCSIGEIAGLIAAGDEFVGYDSACQHIAAAAGIPACVIFAGSNNPRFVRRWHACGRARTEVVHVDTLTAPQRFDEEDIITRIIHARQTS